MSTTQPRKPKSRNLPLGDFMRNRVSTGMDELVAFRRSSSARIDRRHVTIRTDPISGRTIGLNREGLDWDRLSLRAKAILEGERRS